MVGTIKKPKMLRWNQVVVIVSSCAFLSLWRLQATPDFVSSPLSSDRGPCHAHVSSRRDLVNVGLVGSFLVALGWSSPASAYELMPLPYPSSALEPSIDKTTMEIHHDKHHQTYITNINKAMEGKPQLPLWELQKTAIKDGPAFRNSGGGSYNHNFFWVEMAPTGTGGKPSEKLTDAIKADFGSFDDFKAKWEAASAPGARFGSGWVWLVLTKDKKLAITSTPNQDNPLMEGVEGTMGIPILALDVWEHAYYLKYQWNRPAYVKNWWSVVNWNQVSAWYEDALRGQPPVADGGTVSAATLGEMTAPSLLSRNTPDVNVPTSSPPFLPPVHLSIRFDVNANFGD